MSTPAKPEPSPREKFQAFARKVISVPKAEIDRREQAQKLTEKKR